MVFGFVGVILRYLSAAVLALTLAAGGRPGGGAIDLAPFEALARKADCANSSNRLYVIDGQMVYWDRTGFCGDNAYAYTLFGATPDRVLCSRQDSIIGPRGTCQEAVRPLFETIVQHRGETDLGLGASHTVRLAFTGPGPR